MSAPADQLAPVGWVCTRNDPAEIAFEHEEWPGAVRAVRESEDRWRVEVTERAGEAESTRIVGYACTRNRALDALSTSMSAMNRVADRTGVVRTMMASTLALYGDAGVRGVAPEWRAADRPFERQVSTETPREPWRRADPSAGDHRDGDGARADDRAADAGAAGGEGSAGGEGGESDADGGRDVDGEGGADGDDGRDAAPGAVVSDDASAAESGDRRPESPDPPRSPDEGSDDAA